MTVFFNGVIAFVMTTFQMIVSFIILLSRMNRWISQNEYISIHRSCCSDPDMPFVSNGINKIKLNWWMLALKYHEYKYTKVTKFIILMWFNWCQIVISIYSLLSIKWTPHLYNLKDLLLQPIRTSTCRWIILLPFWFWAWAGNNEKSHWISIYCSFVVRTGTVIVQNLG